MITTHFAQWDKPKGTRREMTMSDLGDFLSRPVETTSKEAMVGWSPVQFRTNYRLLKNVEQVFAVGLDFDKDVQVERVLDAFAEYYGFIHSTFRHTPEAPRLRVILPTTKPMDAGEYSRVWASMAHGLAVDKACKDASRFWVAPCCQPGGEFVCHELNGGLLDPSTVPDAPAPPVPDYANDYVRDDSPLGWRTERARLYLEKIPPAVSGSAGHTTTFVTAMKLTRGFDLPEGVALTLLREWNYRCQPPWSDAALARKVHQAAASGDMPVGALLGNKRK